MSKIDGLDNRQISNLSEDQWQIFHRKNKELIWKRDNFDFEQRVEMLKHTKEIIDSGFNALTPGSRI